LTLALLSGIPSDSPRRVKGHGLRALIAALLKAARESLAVLCAREEAGGCCAGSEPAAELSQIPKKGMPAAMTSRV
jgi:hypothetical protein